MFITKGGRTRIKRNIESFAHIALYKISKTYKVFGRQLVGKYERLVATIRIPLVIVGGFRKVDIVLVKPVPCLRVSIGPGIRLGGMWDGMVIVWCARVSGDDGDIEIIWFGFAEPIVRFLDRFFCFTRMTDRHQGLNL